MKFDNPREVSRPTRNIGRIMLGKHAGRLVLTPDDGVKLIISSDAVEDGSVILREGYEELITHPVGTQNTG